LESETFPFIVRVCAAIWEAANTTHNNKVTNFLIFQFLNDCGGAI
jgi:hypothetical protein